MKSGADSGLIREADIEMAGAQRIACAEPSKVASRRDSVSASLRMGHGLFCVKAGQTAFRHVFGGEIFPCLAWNIKAAKVFDEAMTGAGGTHFSFSSRRSPLG